MSRATYTFGRFNVPTEIGHGKLITAVQAHAEESSGKHYIFPSHSQDAEKNPLEHSEKVRFMNRMFPTANIVSHKNVRTAIDAIKHLEKQGHTHVTMVVGSDRVDNFKSLLNKYRKKEFPGIKKVDVISAGNRDPDAEGAEGMSASKLRALVKAGKRNEFISHYSNKKLGAEIYDAAKKGMQMESVNPVGIFLLGGPGSGKDYVLKNIFSRFDLTEVQADQILNGVASELLESKKNIVINGANDEEKISVIQSMLEDYVFDYVYVSVTNKVSRLRNEQREQPILESKRIHKFLSAEKLADNYDCFRFNNSINLNESSEFERVFFASQIEKLLERVVSFGLEMKAEPEPKSFFVIKEKYFPPVRRDKESGLPKKYVAGLSRSTAKARAAHWKEKSKLSDSDPRAYEPAPGDKTAKTKLSKYTKKYHAMYGEASSPAQQAAIAIDMKERGIKPKNEEVELDEGDADSSLSAKARKSGISVGTLRKVYKRGVAAWNSGHRPGTTPQQWGHARVNSYITKGKTYHTADKDLREDNEPATQKPHLTVDQIAKKHNVDVAEIEKQLKLGQKIEHEHTKDMDVATDIALNHLGEFPDYYTRLTKLEKQAKASMKSVTEQGQIGVPDKPLMSQADRSAHNAKVQRQTRVTHRWMDHRNADIHRIATANEEVQVDEINQLAEMQLFGTDSYRKHAIAMTPGQGELEDAFPVKNPNEYDAKDKTKSDADCGCDDDCDCKNYEENAETGKRDGENVPRSFRSIRTEAKTETSTVNLEPKLADKKKKISNLVTPPANLDSTLHGLPVASRYNAYEQVERAPKQKPSWMMKKGVRKVFSGRTAVATHEEVSLEEAVKYHLDNKISFTENVFRPGSDMFFSMIAEAKRLYAEGQYTPADEWEKDMLESNIGEIAEFEGQQVVLDYPIEEGLEECWKGYTQKGMKKKGDKMVPNCVPMNEADDPTDGKGIGKPFRSGGGGAVYVRVGDGVRKINFSQSGMTKKYMDPAATRSFVARHHCLTNKDKTSRSYWACRWPRFFSNSGKIWW